MTPYYDQLKSYCDERGLNVNNCLLEAYYLWLLEHGKHYRKTVTDMEMFCSSGDERLKLIILAWAKCPWEDLGVTQFQAEEMAIKSYLEAIP